MHKNISIVILHASSAEYLPHNETGLNSRADGANACGRVERHGIHSVSAVHHKHRRDAMHQRKSFKIMSGIAAAGLALPAFAQTSSTVGAAGNTSGSGYNNTTLGTGGSAAGSSGSASTLGVGAASAGRGQASVGLGTGGSSAGTSGNTSSTLGVGGATAGKSGTSSNLGTGASAAGSGSGTSSTLAAGGSSSGRSGTSSSVGTGGSSAGVAKGYAHGKKHHRHHSGSEEGRH